MGKNWTGNNRAPWHDYTSRQIYHITLRKHSLAMPFGSLAGDWRIKPGVSGSPYIAASPLGQTIKACLRELPVIHPALRLYQYALMPNHLHIILSVESQLDDILGHKIAAFKVLVNKRAHTDHVFDRGFNDQLLTLGRNLDTIFNYLRENPYRLALRRANPDFFTRVNNISVGNFPCQLYGNMNLLANPFKEQVIVHRADSVSIKNTNRERWLHCGANGGVLVSPFISPAEKAIRAEAEDAGAKIILLTHEAFGERYKPAAHDFDLCCQGRLLIVSLGQPQGAPLLRAHCLQMNTLAQTLATQILEQPQASAPD